MQAYVCKEVGTNIIYISPMHITERAIIGYDIPNTHPGLANLSGLDQVMAKALMQGEIKLRKGQYLLQAMKKIKKMGVSLPHTSSGH
jgi:hypothetical protein